MSRHHEPSVFHKTLGQSGSVGSYGKKQTSSSVKKILEDLRWGRGRRETRTMCPGITNPVYSPRTSPTPKSRVAYSPFCIRQRSSQWLPDATPSTFYKFDDIVLVGDAAVLRRGWQTARSAFDGTLAGCSCRSMLGAPVDARNPTGV